jgi:RNA polymerase sigma-B factor
LFRRSRRGDAEARDLLVDRYLPLAKQLARRYHGSKEPLEDLIQVASIGLVKAVDNFDPDRGTAFSSYAVPTVLGELKRHFRDRGWAVHVPRALQEKALHIERAREDLTGELGRSPSAHEIADEVGISDEELGEALEVISAHDAVSLDAPRALDPEGDAQTYAEVLGSDDQHLELVEYGASIAPALEDLSNRDRVVIHLRFIEDLSQAAIAERVGVSQMHVSRIIRRSARKLSAAAAA